MITLDDRTEEMRQAIVVGGSIAGLLAAQVLAAHFERVTIIERDSLPQHSQPRSGVPQARHAHILLARGYQILTQLFPDLEAELRTLGVPRLDVALDARWYSPVGWGPRFRSGIESIFCSRDLLESCIRSRVLALPNVRLLQQCEVGGLLADAAHARVHGVRARWRADPQRAAEPVFAGLVVDASGRTSRASTWLEELGFPPPRKDVVQPFLRYVSRCYAPAAGAQTARQFVVVQPRPPSAGRGGVLIPIEGRRWIVSLIGAGAEQPAPDEAGLLAFARSLPHPIIYEALVDATPLSDIYGYQRTENRRYYYEALPRWPEGFVVLGDAACCFNPAYGQGMTLAALAALQLSRELRQQRQRRPDGSLAGLARRFQTALARLNNMPWLLATGEDFRYPTTAGAGRSPATRLVHWYTDRVLLLAARQPAVLQTFLQVLHLQRPPHALLHPDILLQVLRHARQRVR